MLKDLNNFTQIRLGHKSRFNDNKIVCILTFIPGQCLALLTSTLRAM